MIPGLINPNRSQVPTKTGAENLVTKVSGDNLTRPPGFWASIVLDVLAVIAAGVSGWLYHSFLLGHRPLWQLLTATGIFSVCAVFQALLAHGQTRRAVILLLEIISLVAFFYALPLVYLAAVAGGGFVFFIWGEIATSREVQNSMEIKFFSAIKPQLNRIITALSLLAVLLYLPQWDEEQSFLSRSTVDLIYNQAVSLVHNFYPELKLDGTLGEFAESLVKFQTGGNIAFNQLSPPAKVKVLEDGKTQMIQDLQLKAHIIASANDPASLVAYRALIQQFVIWRESSGNKFLFVWAVLAFFALRGFGFIFYAVVGFASYFLYQVFLSLNVIRVVGESRMKETLEYS